MADVDRDINVTAKFEDGQVKFSMSGSGVGGTKNEEIEFDKNKNSGMKKNDRYLVRFNLKDETGLKLRYVKPKENAMWAKVVGKVSDPCPHHGDHLNQFRASQRIDDALIVINQDKDKELIKFALNFMRDGGNDDDPAQYVQYDPIGDNRNGGQEGITQGIARIALIGVGLAAVALLAFRAFSE